MPRLNSPKTIPGQANSSLKVSAADPVRLFAGTSGWAYPTWKPGFYPNGVSSKKFLGFYSSLLNSVEVNYTFTKLPTAGMVQGWLDQAGPGFRFSFKAPQRITHYARLRECGEHVAAFLKAVEPAAAAGKLGLLLFQLPPNFKADPDRLRMFLELFPQGSPPLAFEFRHPTWFCAEVYEVLRAGGAALCVADTDTLQTPEVHTAGGHTCFRLRKDGGYKPAALKDFATRFAGLAQEREVYVYFRHQDEPTGALNAAAFRKHAARAAKKA